MLGVRRPCRIIFLVIGEDVFVFGFAFCPVHKLLLVGLLLFVGAEFFQLLGFAVEEFPVVRNTGIVTGEFQFHGRIFHHLLVHQFQTHITQSHQRRILDLVFQFDTIAGFVAVRASGISVDHRVVTIFHALNRNRQEMLGLHRYVIGAVLRWLTVFRGIYTEHREITGMTWPFPVVGITTVFTYTFWRRSHQTNIAVGFVHIHNVLVALEHGVDASGQTIFFIGHFIGDRLIHFLQFLGTLGPSQAFQLGFYLSGHIFNTIEELNR